MIIKKLREANAIMPTSVNVIPLKKPALGSGIAGGITGAIGAGAGAGVGSGAGAAEGVISGFTGSIYF